MQISDLVDRQPPRPWHGNTKIPWHEPAFSERMLREHLDQSHAQASRPRAMIERQVRFLHDVVLNGAAGRVLDLGCGPGLYCAALAGLGHRCTGIDFSPASIRYARQQDSASKYLLADVTDSELGNGFDLVMMTFGEFNTFSQAAGRALLARMRDAAFPGGTVVLEVSDHRAIAAVSTPATWRAVERSVFSDEPHLWLQEQFWFEAEMTAVERHYVIVGDGTVRAYSNTLQAWRQHDYVSLLQGAGFRRIRRESSLTDDPGLFFLLAGS